MKQYRPRRRLLSKESRHDVQLERLIDWEHELGDCLNPNAGARPSNGRNALPILIISCTLVKLVNTATRTRCLASEVILDGQRRTIVCQCWAGTGPRVTPWLASKQPGLLQVYLRSTISLIRPKHAIF